MGYRCSVINMSTLSPVDEAAIVKAARETGAIVTAEEHLEHGALAGIVSQVVVRNHPVPMEFVALKGYAQSGKPGDLLVRYGLTSGDIEKAVRRVLGAQIGTVGEIPAGASGASVQDVFQRIWDLALPYQDKRQDAGHAEVSLSYPRRLVDLEGGDEDVVIPAIILHDVGWSQLPEDERMLVFGKDVKDEERRRVQLWHERESVRVGRGILEGIGYPPARSDEILEIISQHDTRHGFISKNEGLTRMPTSSGGSRSGVSRRESRGGEGESDKTIERLKADLEKADYLYSGTARRLAQEELEGRKAEYAPGT